MILGIQFVLHPTWNSVLQYKILQYSFFYQMTPLHIAAEKGRYRMVKYLVGITPNISTEDHDGVGACDYNWQFGLAIFQGA